MINSIIQALLYNFKFIIGGNGNLDLYYFFSIIVFFSFFIKRPQYLKKLAYIIAAIMVSQLIIGSLNGISQNYQRNVVTISKMCLNVILMIYVSCKYEKWNIKQFIDYVTLIFFMETIAALIFRNSTLWRHNDLINIYSKTRLQLFYVEPSELSLHCGFLIILILISIIENGFNKKYIFNMTVAATDLVLTAGMSGIASLVIAIMVYILIRLLRRDVTKTFVALIMTFLVAGASVLVLKRELLYRGLAILNGTDGSLYSRVLGPGNVLMSVLRSTKYMGLGAGMLNTSQGFSHTGLYYKFPNSIMYFIAEFGILGILLLVFLNYKILKIIAETKKYYLIMPWVYITVFQIIGGYYTNPFFWLVYGILFSYKYRNRKKDKLEIQEMVNKNENNNS